MAAHVERADPATPLPDGRTDVRGWASAGRALLCRKGVEQMYEDAAVAVRQVGEGSLPRALARMLLGVATLLRGEVDAAPGVFEDAVREAMVSGATFSLIVSQSELALLAIDRGDLGRAEATLETAATIVDDDVLPEYVSASLLLAARARLATRRGERDRAREDLRLAQRVRPQIPDALPWFAVLTRLELARAHADLGDVDGARTVLGEARRTLATSPPLGVLAQQAEDLRDQLGAMAARSDPWASTMTAAELRLLPLLTTHLTFQEIGTRLYVSRNTIKTQAISIYRKLGASSRSDAIARAAELGLVDAAVLKTAR
jgi:LuxR family maltose regulon positive regulatory protein